MAALSFLLSYLAKKIGNILQLVLGWSVTALFGKLPERRQLLLTVALVLSIVWPLFVLGLIAPGLAGWAIALLPLDRWVGAGALRIIWASLAAFTPGIVGLVVRVAAPTGRQQGFFKIILQGYPLTLGFFSAFVVVAVTVPIVKLVSIARGWTDEHVYVEPRAGEYDCVLRSVAEACARAGLVPEVTDVPKQMALATAIMRTFFRGSVVPMVTTGLRRIRAKGLELYLYPADLLLRGESKKVARVRAMLSRTRVDAHAYLVGSPKAQHVQDELARLWDVTSGHEERGEPLGAALASRVRDVFRELARTDVPYAEWIVLESLVRRLERRLLSGGNASAPHLDEEADLIDEVARDANETDAVPHRGARKAMHNPQRHIGDEKDPLDDLPTSSLLSRVLSEAKDLARVEVELAKEDVLTEAKGAMRAGVAFGITAGAALLVLDLLLLALVLAVGGAAWVSLVLALIFGALAGAAGVVGYMWLPKKPLEPTRRRLGSDVDRLKEHVA